MLQDGDMRRSDEELGELMRSGTSAALCSDILVREWRKGTNQWGRWTSGHDVFSVRWRGGGSAVAAAPAAVEFSMASAVVLPAQHLLPRSGQVNSNPHFQKLQPALSTISLCTERPI